jgi:membrane protein required for colicin V production
VTFPFIQPWGPKVIEGFGKILPVFQGMFDDLKDFFGDVSDHVPAAK